jgi:hypothetical protein
MSGGLSGSPVAETLSGSGSAGKEVGSRATAALVGRQSAARAAVLETNVRRFMN